ncbi:MAG: glutamate 5-kinase [Neomegalonema sp.]|nr:glutamate 5-kinase [Neomegalonema sp.]
MVTDLKHGAAATTLPRLSTGKRVVVKIGSALLVDAEQGLRLEWLRALIDDVALMRASGLDVVLVSSGSIALGREVLHLSGRLVLEEAQAAAAVGQIALSRSYAEALETHGISAAQVLLTLADTQDRRRYLNGRETLRTLLKLGCVPIVNENDTVATDEIRYGDNDRLAARVALMVGADRLVLLSDVDGLYSADPRKDPAARHFPLIEEITPEIEAMAGGAGTAHSKGGMKTKIEAAKTATSGGCAMAITLGAPLRPLSALENGARASWFAATKSPKAARKQWIAGMKPLGVLTIDDGAVAALARGKSLLPAGVRTIAGKFERGDAVEIRSMDGAHLATALSAYSSVEAAQIAGHHSQEVEAILGFSGRVAMAHRDDMALRDDTRNDLTADGGRNG